MNKPEATVKEKAEAKAAPATLAPALQMRLDTDEQFPNYDTSAQGR